MEYGDERMKKLPKNRSDLQENRLVFDDYIARLQENRRDQAKVGRYYDGLRTPTVQFWCWTGDAMIILLSNNAIQVFSYTIYGKLTLRH